MARSSDEEVQVSVEEKLDQAKEYKSLGNELYKAKEYRNAIGKYHRALLYLKAMPWASVNGLGVGLGGLADMMNSKTKAKAPPAADMKLKPESDKLSADCYNNIAACMLQQEKPNYERIVSHCESSLALSSNNLKATYRKGVAQYYLKDYESSLNTLKSARELPNGDKDKNITMFMSMCKKALETQEKELDGIYRTMLGAHK